MSLHDDLLPVLALDPRYTIEAYHFVLQALGHAKTLKGKRKAHSASGRPRAADKSRRSVTRRQPGHVSGQELCQGARDLALRQYGLLALPLLQTWGIHSSSDLGNIVYNMIASGDLEKTADDSREDFEHALDLSRALREDVRVVVDREEDVSF